jgi:8-oxo-dGTP pyrophosphatase MutT (NUDIX family)
MAKISPNNLNDFSVLLKALKISVDSKEAHLQMSSYARPNWLEAIKKEEYRKSGVLILLYQNAKNEICFPLIKRPTYNGVHSAQIALPGGKSEMGENSSETALREANEEIGADPSQIQLIKKLTPVYIPPSKFLVKPHLGFTPIMPKFKAEPKEVEQILEVSVLDLLNESNFTNAKVLVGVESIRMNVPCFQFENQIVWGATAMILNELKYILNSFLDESF